METSTPIKLGALVATLLLNGLLFASTAHLFNGQVHDDRAVAYAAAKSPGHPVHRT